MWSENSIYGHASNCRRICHTPYCHPAAMTCLCTASHASLYASNSNPITQWHNNVLPYSTNLLTYQGPPQNPISGFSHLNNPVDPLFHVEIDQEAREQMATKYRDEIDSWLLPNPDNGEDQNNLSSHQIDCCLNLRRYSPWTGNQYQGQFNQLQSQGFQQVNQSRNFGMLPLQSSREGLAEQQQQQILKFSHEIQQDFSRAAFSNTPAKILDASLPPTGAGIASEATIGSFSNTMDLPREWAQNQFFLLPSHPGNLIDETVGSHSNSTSISSEGTQLISGAASKKLFKFPPMSRQERVLRYFEKKKARKYEKKIQYSSRKTYAQTRPRVRGRFTRSSQTDAQ